ncbi:hypothetical protein OAX11_02155 [Flavobacteriaceae bacterium]|nr:hypothetical protein [Flavobacteriaceae bacterium]
MKNAISNLSYNIAIYKNDELYELYNYNPTNVNPKYLSSSSKWIKSRKKMQIGLCHHLNSIH